MKGQKLEIRNNGNSNTTIKYQNFNDSIWRNGVILRANQIMKIWCVKGTFSSVSKNVVILSSLDWPLAKPPVIGTSNCVLPDGLIPFNVLTSIVLENPSEIITFDLTFDPINDWMYLKSDPNYINRNEIRTYTSIYSYNPQRMVLYDRRTGCKAINGFYVSTNIVYVTNGVMEITDDTGTRNPTPTPTKSLPPTPTPTETPTPTPTKTLTPTPTPSLTPNFTHSLRLTFDTTENINLLVGDPTNVLNWNVFFDSWNYGNSFSSVTIDDVNVILFGGGNLTIKNNLFEGNNSLIGIVDEFNCVISLGDYVFSSCLNLTTINLPSVTYCGEYCFNNTPKVEVINLPNLMVALSNSFNGESVLTELSLPSLINAGTYCFNSRSNVTKFYLPNLISIENYGFNNCTSITDLYIPSILAFGETFDSYEIFNSTTGNTINLTVSSYVMTGNTGLPDTDIQYLIDNNNITLTIVDVQTSSFTQPSLMLVFDDISNAETLMGYSLSVTDWNTFFDLPTYGNPFTSVEVSGNTVSLFGGSNINLKDSLFVISGQGPALLQINDNARCIISAGNNVFGDEEGTGCPNLTTVYLPELLSAGDSCFTSTISLVNVSMDKVTSIGNYCFNGSNLLSTISLPVVKTIKNEAFGNTILTTINTPSCIRLGFDVGNNNIFNNITGQTITLTIPSELMTCNEGLPDGDVQYLIDNNDVTVIEITIPIPTPTPTPTPTPIPIPTPTPSNDLTYMLLPDNDLYYELIEPTPTPTQTPTNTPTETPTPTPTPSNVPIIYDVDYVVFKYNFAMTSGADLDTSTTLYVNESTTPYTNIINPVGYCDNRGLSGSSGNSGVWVGPNLWWGGDNTEFGTESVYVDVANLKLSGSVDSVQINCEANWYGAVGDGILGIQMFAYSGGTMVSDGDYGFTNVGGTLLGNYDFPNVEITLLDEDCTGTQCVGLYGYNILTGTFTVQPCYPKPTPTPTKTQTPTPTPTAIFVDCVNEGLLYNWQAATYSGTGNTTIAPAGWHLPTIEEFNTLRTFLSNSSYDLIDGTKWVDYQDTQDCTNSLKFNVWNNRERTSSGQFRMSYSVYFWASQDDNYKRSFEVYGCCGDMYTGSESINRGHSIRLIKDDSDNTGTMTDYDGNVYSTVKIGDQVWLSQNLMVTHYNDGTPIPYAEDDTTWATSSDAFCAYEGNWANVGCDAPTPTPTPTPTNTETPTNTPTPTNTQSPLPICITNAGTYYLNGTYDFSQIINGKNAYSSTTIDIIIFWGGGTWYIQQVWNGQNLYSSSDDVLTPNLVTSWITIWGVEPLPIVTEGICPTSTPTPTPTPTPTSTNTPTITQTPTRTPLPPTEVFIGTQIFTNSNLDVTTYRDGTEIPQVTGQTAWDNLTTGAWCYYANNTANGVVYGKLYNWYAVAGIDGSGIPRNLAPLGYHIPTDAEWTTLTTYLGGESVAGGKMKSTGTSLWTNPNTGATNESGFTGLPGGGRYSNVSFNAIGILGFWWSSSEDIFTRPWYRNLSTNYNDVSRSTYNKKDGFSVRLIKDESTPTPTPTPTNTPTPT